MKTWVSYGSTESSDDLPVLLWKKKPTDKMVERAYRKLLPLEFEEIGFVNWKLSEAAWVKP